MMTSLPQLRPKSESILIRHRRKTDGGRVKVIQHLLPDAIDRFNTHQWWYSPNFIVHTLFISILFFCFSSNTSLQHTKISNGSKHHRLLPLLIVTANTFLTMCMIRTCALWWSWWVQCRTQLLGFDLGSNWWSRGELNSLFEQIGRFYCALLPAFSYFFRTFSCRWVSTRDRFWRVKSTGKSTWGEKERWTKIIF